MKASLDLAYDMVKYKRLRHDADLSKQQRNNLILSLLEEDDVYEVLVEKMNIVKLIKNCLEGYSNPSILGKAIIRELNDCMESKVEDVFDEALESYEGLECAGDIEYADALSRTRDMQSSVRRAIV